jgi:tetratricopeptide (TPR) repeat protein
VAEEARSIGLHDVVVTSHRLRMFTTFWRGDFEGALRESISVEEKAKLLDPLTTARGLADGASCLAQLEREIPRAQAMLIEAQRITDRLGEEPPELIWGSGCIGYILGQHDSALPILERAAALCRGNLNQWPAWDSLMRVVRIHLESGRFEAALSRTSDLLELAAKLGEGSEIPVSENLRALARLGLRENGAQMEVDRTLRDLEVVDARAFHAYALALAAEIDLQAGRVDSAITRAERALGEATYIERWSELVWANIILARAALQTGDRGKATLHLETARSCSQTIRQAIKEKVLAIELELSAEES